jgi:hypothetical protein
MGWRASYMPKRGLGRKRYTNTSTIVDGGGYSPLIYEDIATSFLMD